MGSVSDWNRSHRMGGDQGLSNQDPSVAFTHSSQERACFLGDARAKLAAFAQASALSLSGSCRVDVQGKFCQAGFSEGVHESNHHSMRGRFVGADHGRLLTQWSQLP